MGNVLIIGAGLAGLACATTLHARGQDVTVVDKGRGVGGRLATRRIGEAAYDTGAQFLTVRDPGFGRALQAAGAMPWGDGFPLLGSADARGDGHARWRMPGGMNRLAKFLAQGVPVRDQHTVTAITTGDGQWIVRAEPGDLVKPGSAPTGPAVELRADAVVLTAPAPQAVQLLQRCGLEVPASVAAARYAPCLCLMLDYPAGEALLPYPGGMRVEDDAVVSWFASQRRKELRAAGEGLIVHAGGSWSAAHYGESDEAIVAQLWPAARAVLARAGITAEPASVQLKKWKYSLPIVTVPEVCTRIEAPLPLILAGDAFGDRPRAEGAWLSGVAAADLLSRG
jgi:renalase